MTSPQTPTAAPHRGPNCWNCRFFGVSHFPAAPYICRAMGFQTKVLPSIEVLRTDGQFCRSFEAKASVSVSSNP